MMRRWWSSALPGAGALGFSTWKPVSPWAERQTSLVQAWAAKMSATAVVCQPDSRRVQ